LEQVTDNLLSNALKFGAGRPVHVSLRSDGQSASLTVRDQGAGIPEEDRARIFKRFEQAVTRREHGGFGIGLWLVNQLTTAMGGSIELESARGEGTTFTVVLPVAGPEQKASTDL
jgi:signal transduction histidine kinase